jgi:small subunit ribosomal protein S4
MARYTGAVCRLCRREGTKLFLKGTKCTSDRCPLEKRNFPPGQHGKDRKAKIVGYGLQLHEKQKAKRMYFTLEGQFREYYEKANRATGVTGELLIQQLERRWTTWPSVWALPSRASGPPGGSPRPRHGQRPQGQHSFLPGERGRRDRHPRERQEACLIVEQGAQYAAQNPFRHGSKPTSRTFPAACSRCPSARTSTCPSTSS